MLAYKLYMNENNNLSYYPENITIKDGKVTTESLNNSQNENIGKNSNTQNKSPNTPPLNLLMSLIGNNKNMTDILPILLAKNANLNSEQLTSLMKNFQKTWIKAVLLFQKEDMKIKWKLDIRHVFL